MKPTALIAEDEPLLAQALQAELVLAWPDLQVIATVGDGHSAVRESLRLLPDVLFLDVRMPGLDGLTAATELADAWPTDDSPLPQLVFVTAYDEYAAQAFDAQAIDYVLKPVQPERLKRTVTRLQKALTLRKSAAVPSEDVLASTLAQWRKLLSVAGGASEAVGSGAPLKFITASEAGSSGATVHMVAIDDVQYFEAADKYVRVITAHREHLIRISLRELIPQLDPRQFWQVHRGTLVQAREIAQAQRDEAGKVHLLLRQRPEKLAVSRLYAARFKGM
jgi:DNA-binding LytR/AlgR family response regulator